MAIITLIELVSRSVHIYNQEQPSIVTYESAGVPDGLVNLAAGKQQIRIKVSDTENSAIDPRAGKLVVYHQARNNAEEDDEDNETILELEDCRSDIFDDFDIAFLQEELVEWKCIKDFANINL